MIRKYGLPALGLILLLFAVYHVVRAQQTPPKTNPLVEPAHSPFEAAIAGTGMVEPETESIAVGSPLSGVVQEVLVKVGNKIERDKTPLFRLDDRSLRAELVTRETNLQAAQAQLERLQATPRPEDVPPAEARLKEMQENLADKVDQYDRIATLVGTAAVTDDEIMRRKQAMEVARQQMHKADADLKLLKAGAWKSDLAVSTAAVEQARALVKQTRVELDRLEVRASVDGEVLQVNVHPGEFVGTPPGQTLMVIGAVRKNVRVDIDENDLARFRPGLAAKATRRGDALTEIPLTFVRVEPFVVPKKSLAGGTAERVDTRVLQVIYAVDGDRAPLFVGQQVDVFLDPN